MPEVRTRICVLCSNEFTYPMARGADRKYCSDRCRTQFWVRANQQRIASGAWPVCTVQGCGKLSQGPQSRYCKACITQKYRTGGFSRKPHKGKLLTSHGYYTVVRIGHPLSNRHGRVYEHRQVLFDAVGPGPQPCHWCGTEVRWLKGICALGALVPDHLDGNKGNNAQENLVPACNRCNASRGMFMAWVREHKDDPVLWALYLKALEANVIASKEQRIASRPC